MQLGEAAAVMATKKKNTPEILRESPETQLQVFERAAKLFRAQHFREAREIFALAAVGSLREQLVPSIRRLRDALAAKASAFQSADGSTLICASCSPTRWPIIERGNAVTSINKSSKRFSMSIVEAVATTRLTSGDL